MDGLESALEAAEGGADRIELCSSIVVGGVTPSAGLVELTCRALRGRCGVYVLVRPRGGDFLYSQSELEVGASLSQSELEVGATPLLLEAGRLPTRLLFQGSCRRS